MADPKKPTGGKWKLEAFDEGGFTFYRILSGIEHDSPITEFDCDREKAAALITALQNAAIDINPDNPMAVAEGMEKCVDVLKRCDSFASTFYVAIKYADDTEAKAKMLDLISKFKHISSAALDAVRAKPEGEADENT